nr:hypothetical protein Q903MT_gene1110 [Picea sitchensis]
MIVYKIKASSNRPVSLNCVHCPASLCPVEFKPHPLPRKHGPTSLYMPQCKHRPASPLPYGRATTFLILPSRVQASIV